VHVTTIRGANRTTALVARQDAVTLGGMNAKRQASSSRSITAQPKTTSRGTDQRGGSVRIIGGEWRSRKLNFPSAEGLRPTADRVRETLFNWLQRSVPAARVLDLFAGSGALGFEAASRGASSVVLVEKNAAAAASLRVNKQALAASSVEVIAADALQWLAANSQRTFDLVFVDPPFAEAMQLRVCQALADSGCLAPGALVYVETAAPLAAESYPAGWRVAKTKRAGAVHSTLLQIAPLPTAPLPVAPAA
jgi:16S rRNA (guanine966-N2)-methyltransferase